MKINAVKILIASAIASVAVYMRDLLIPLIVLIAVMVADYITGMTRAWITGTFSSRVGIRGIAKKLLYLVLVLVGMAVDYLMTAAIKKTGVEIDAYGLVGLIVTVWLIINELISILENLAQSGVPVPAFLVKLIGRLKVETEKKGDSLSENQSEGERDP